MSSLDSFQLLSLIGVTISTTLVIVLISNALLHMETTHYDSFEIYRHIDLKRCEQILERSLNFVKDTDKNNGTKSYKNIPFEIKTQEDYERFHANS